MVPKRFLARVRAYIYARMIYRDSPMLENKHAGSGSTDIHFYYEFVEMLTGRIEEMKHLCGYITADYDTLGEKQKFEYRMVSLVLRSMERWDEPRTADDKYDGGETAEYLLRGEFYRVCKENLKLTDVLMADINRDVYNRAYTLALKGLI